MHASALTKQLAIEVRPDPSTMERCAECSGPIYQIQVGAKERWVHHFDGPAELAQVEACPAIQEFREAKPATAPAWMKRCPDCQGMGDHEIPEGSFECRACDGVGRVSCAEDEADCLAYPVEIG